MNFVWVIKIFSNNSDTTPFATEFVKCDDAVKVLLTVAQSNK